MTSRIGKCYLRNLEIRNWPAVGGWQKLDGGWQMVDGRLKHNQIYFLEAVIPNLPSNT